MVFRFRIPVWYRYTLLVLYTFLGLVIFEKPLSILSAAIAVYALYALIGLWIVLSWNRTISLDTQSGILEIGKERLSIDGIEDVEMGFFKMSIRFRLKDGSKIVFPYPIEDVEEFLRIFEEMKETKEVIG